jgi:hypothetical protein
MGGKGVISLYSINPNNSTDIIYKRTQTVDKYQLNPHPYLGRAQACVVFSGECGHPRDIVGRDVGRGALGQGDAPLRRLCVVLDLAADVLPVLLQYERGLRRKKPVSVCVFEVSRPDLVQGITIKRQIKRQYFMYFYCTHTYLEGHGLCLGGQGGLGGVQGGELGPRCLRCSRGPAEDAPKHASLGLRLQRVESDVDAEGADVRGA